MKAALVVLVVVTVAVAVPMRMEWLELEKARPITKTARLGDVFSFCNKTLDALVIDSLVLKPDPPVKGQRLTISVAFTLKEVVSGGSAKISAKLDGIPVYDSTYNVCELLKEEFNVVCPVQPFSGSNSTSVDLPSIGGHITANAVVTDQGGKELACVNIDLHL